MMKSQHIIKQLLAVALVFTTMSLHAQNINDINVDYQQLITLVNNGGDKDATYTSLFSCYQKCVSLMEQTSATNAEHTQAQEILKSIMPLLPNGAAYYSTVGNTSKAISYAQAYVDKASLPAYGVQFTSSTSYSQMAYYAASNNYNNGKYQEAIPYFQAYLNSGDEKFRKNVFVFMSKAYGKAGDTHSALTTLERAVKAYPSDYAIVSTAINYSIDSKDNDYLQKFLTQARSIRPDDSTVLNIQGKLYEDIREYQKALSLYSNMAQVHGETTEITKHLALDTYNLGVLNYNAATASQVKVEAEKQNEASKLCFTSAIPYLKQVVSADPMSLKYTEALAIAYKCTGNNAMFDQTNNKLASMGAGRVSSTCEPVLLDYSRDDRKAKHSPIADVAAVQFETTEKHNDDNQPDISDSPIKADDNASVESASPKDATETPDNDQPYPSELPLYSSYAKVYIENKINVWQKKDQYETLSEYRERVNEATRKTKFKEVQREIEQKYIDEYSPKSNWNKLQLKPYDAENGVFLVSSPLGKLVVPVPRQNNEARAFEADWSGMEFKDPKFYIANDRLAIAALTFVTPSGKSYQYNNSAALNYTETVVDVHFDDIEQADIAAATADDKAGNVVQKKSVSVGKSDVDVNIPIGQLNSNNKTFAVIISNENYVNVSKVQMAKNDGYVFAKYCEKTLGLPKSNIRTYYDATYGTMLKAVRDIKDISAAYQGDMNVIFYYAGHGIPNESTKDAYLLPIDADGLQTEVCYPVSKLYSELGGMGAKSVVVFLDACFSGAQRGDGMLASARGIALKAKSLVLGGNLVVFSAASGEETAYPYTEKQHGLFTYFHAEETAGE